MFEITESALENLTSYLQQNNTESAIRIALMQGGCAGPALGLALDDVKDNDTTFQEGTLQFLIEKELLSTCGAVKIDFVEAEHGSGFSITSTNPVGGGGCSSGSCASGSCCS
ncbi:IscA/HesB family protein [Desulfogranum marinum]|uniref:IscA/HesB family protein n=1 Tax=Desulfogranum marinum TaxID=453220 RepID=UPI0019639155|nr:IscA/HesB family protein [Desulfogranum marinum]MBM9514081.1 IscA/HesB family protein [Desulfogranum marinum]